MSIKRIIFLFIIVTVAFAVCIGFWMMHTDVALSPSPERVDNINEGNNDSGAKEIIVENKSENISDANLYTESLPDTSEIMENSKDAKDLPVKP